MDEEAGAEFGFEPGALGGHDLVGVGDGHELFDGDGEHGEGDSEVPAVDEFFEFGGAADAADEVDAFAGAGVVDAEERGEEAILEDGDVELIDGGGVGGGFPGEAIPLAFEVHAAFAGFGGGFFGGGFEGEDGADFGEELFAVLAVEVFDGAVVGEDLQFAGGEEDAEEPVVVFLAGVVGIGFAAFFADVEGGGGAVVAVGDVGGGDLLSEDGGDGEGGGVGEAPDLVADAIGGSDVVDGGLGGEVVVDEGLDAGAAVVGEEDGAGVGAESIDESGAVLLFVSAGFFVLFDDVVFVVLDVADGDEAGLAMVADGLAIEVHAGGGLAEEDAVGLELVEGGAGLGVDSGGVGVDVGVEIDFGAVDVEEAEGVAGGEFGGFVAVDDVIGDGGDGGGVLGGGGEALEGADAHAEWVLGTGFRRRSGRLGGRGVGSSLFADGWC